MFLTHTYKPRGSENIANTVLIVFFLRITAELLKLVLVADGSHGEIVWL